ncbi:MAG: histidine kinase, partial [Ruminococcus sp.]|nr:histidine kinase [Ruminococcus sp.]
MNNKTSLAAMPALQAQVYFDGEYRIGDGPWQDILKGQHISSTQGDVTLKGNFHLLTPDGEYVGPFDGGVPIGLYLNHINLTYFEGDAEPFVDDHENPLYKDTACGEDWIAHTFAGGTEPIEILIHNPHNFGNETAIDDMLSRVSLWSDIEFEKGVLESGEAQRNTGLFFVIISVLFLGSALFSTLIHIKNSRLIWVLGIVVLFAGIYIIYSSKGISFWRQSVGTNTAILGLSMIFYMLFLLLAVVHFLRKTKKVGIIIASALGAADTIFFLLPVFTDILFYDTWKFWVILQTLANICILLCSATEFFCTKGKKRLIYSGAMLPLLAFTADAVMIHLGFYRTGIASIGVFTLFFIVSIIGVLRIIPNSINTLAKAKELETERIILNSQLAESRVSTMMSQIRPHFIYNTLGSIEQLCSLDPPKAGELVHNFSKYLRGNFRELDNPKPILMSQEMEHVQYYVSIEKVRFPDMTFTFRMNSRDFNIPALTVQPIVENALKHGLMKLRTGGTIRVESFETDTHHCVCVEDDGAGFDTSILLDERKHVGIRNIRGRLEAM